MDLFLTTIRIDTLLKKDGNSSKKDLFSWFLTVLTVWTCFETECISTMGESIKDLFGPISTCTEKGSKGPLSDTHLY